jgi:penicillin-binding protein 1A
MRTAVQYSVNTYAIQLLDTIGPRTSFDYGRAFGLSLTDRPGNNDLSLAPLSLGGLTYGVTPMEMAGAYATIANRGVYVEPHLINRIEDSNGVAIYTFTPVYTRVIREDSAWLMTNMLQTVVASGTGTRAAISGIPMGGKTGTTDDLTNAWFCGITPEFSATVWMGYDDQNKPMYNVAGGDVPARLFRSAIQKAYEGVTPSGFPRPNNIVTAEVCSKDGLRPDVLTPSESIITDYATEEFFEATAYSSIYKEVSICSETNLLANEYCPDPVMRLMLDLPSDSRDPNRIPAEVCAAHNMVTWTEQQQPFFFPEMQDRPYQTTNPGLRPTVPPSIPPGSSAPNPSVDGGDPVREPNEVLDLNNVRI